MRVVLAGDCFTASRESNHMIVTNSTSSLAIGLRRSWIPLYPRSPFSAMPRKISSLRRFSYLSAFSGLVHPCQILHIISYTS
jgi:hypothetical protein